MTLGASVGLLASFFQLLEKITLLKNSEAVLTCNLNSVLSCSNVLNAPQSSVFGFPNSMMCLVFFGLMLSAGLIGWFGAQINVRIRILYQLFALFFVGFGFWYLWQSIFNIGALCLYCLFCYSGLLLINAMWFRLNYKDYRLGKRLRRVADKMVASGADLFFWCLIAAAIGLEALIKFA